MQTTIELEQRIIELSDNILYKFSTPIMFIIFALLIFSFSVLLYCMWKVYFSKDRSFNYKKRFVLMLAIGLISSYLTYFVHNEYNSFQFEINDLSQDLLWLSPTTEVKLSEISSSDKLTPESCIYKPTSSNEDCYLIVGKSEIGKLEFNVAMTESEFDKINESDDVYIKVAKLSDEVLGIEPIRYNFVFEIFTK